MNSLHPAFQPRGKRNFKSAGCSSGSFRDARENQDRFAEFCKGRRRLWFTYGLHNLPEWPCCYVVFIDGALVYVGQTENAKVRFSAHRAKGVVRGIEFSRVTIKLKLPRKYGEWAMTELRLIKRLRPLLNRSRVASMPGGML